MTHADLPPRLRSRLRAPSASLWCLVALGALVGVVEGVVLAADNPDIAGVVAIPCMLGVLYVGMGCLAWWRRPSNRVGGVLIAGGFAWFLSGLSNATLPALLAVGEITATLPFAAVAHLVLVYPTGRTAVRGSRTVIALTYITTLVLQAPSYLFERERDQSPLFVADRPDLLRLGVDAQHGLTVLVVVLTAWLVVRRYRSSTPAVRRALAPVAGYGVFALASIPLIAEVVAPLVGLDPISRFVIQAAVLALVPVAFLLGVFLGRYARTGEVTEMAWWFLPAVRDRAEVKAAIASALGDPSSEILYWLEAYQAYANLGGDLVELPATGTDRRASEIRLEGRRVGAIVYDETLVNDPELVRVAGDALALALDRQRLVVELVASRDALAESRARIVEADERSRRRVARDLHDGLQGRLVVLAMQIGALAARLPPGPSRDQATELRGGIEQAIHLLRDMVRDMMPALLVERGLVAATREVVEGLPIPTELRCSDPIGRFDPTLESAAFFVVAEALANTLKHSRATAVEVSLRVSEDLLHIEVADDGIGGCVPSPNGGLRGLIDRVEALGGRMRLDSPPGAGTRMQVLLPCVS